jgi:hypothetical protein
MISSVPAKYSIYRFWSGTTEGLTSLAKVPAKKTIIPAEKTTYFMAYKMMGGRGNVKSILVNRTGIFGQKNSGDSASGFNDNTGCSRHPGKLSRLKRPKAEP